ncbi:hypothetical protein D3C73_768150 [compost metagenome]
MESLSSSQTSNLKRIAIILSAQIKADPKALINRFLSPEHSKMVAKFMPMLAMMGIPKVEDMLSGIFEKLADLPTDFWLNFEDNLIDILDGSAEAEQRLFDWLEGVSRIENTD